MIIIFSSFRSVIVINWIVWLICLVVGRMSKLVSAFEIADPIASIADKMGECAITYPEDRPIIVGVAGGSGSGKTTIARHLLEILGENHITYIPHDNYYKDLSHLTEEERDARNFDHPDALDTHLMIADLHKLKSMEAVQIPVYDFKTHTRKSDTASIVPRRVILIEGVLIFADEELANLIDIKIYVDTESDIRFIRRLQRDVLERQRDVEGVINQYMTSVKPMHTLYVEPSKRLADVIIPSGYNRVALDLVSHRLLAAITKSTICEDNVKRINDATIH